MFMAFLFYISLGLASPFSVAATQNTNSTISGYIFDSSRRPLSNLYVELLDEVEAIAQRTKTDGGGRFVFSRLSKGIYYVRPVTSGTNFVSQTTRVELVVVSGVRGSGAVNEEVSFTLKTVDEEKGRGKVAPAGTVFYQNIPDEARKLYENAVEQIDSKNNQQGGIEGLQKAVAIFPDYYQALERLGAEYIKRGQYAQAQEVLNKAV